MISDMMKRSIPSVGACTLEDWWAGGGPWCSAWPWEIEAASIG